MGTILVAFILIAFVAASLVMIVKLNSKDKNRERAELVNRFRKLAAHHNLTILEEEILDDLVIGLDGKERKLLVLKRINKDRYDSLLIDLFEVTASEKREIYGRVYPSKYAVLSDVMQLERVVLELRFEDDREPVEITFYDFIANSYHDIGEMKKKVKRWENLLSRLEIDEVRRRA